MGRFKNLREAVWPLNANLSASQIVGGTALSSRCLATRCVGLLQFLCVTTLARCLCDRILSTLSVS